MINELDPIEGNWYLDLDNEQAFEVVSVDEDNGLIEIQYADGSLEEIDLDAWYELEIEPTEAPEDWEEDRAETEEFEYDEDEVEPDELDEERDSLEDEREESWKDEDD